MWKCTVTRAMVGEAGSQEARRGLWTLSSQEQWCLIDMWLNYSMRDPGNKAGKGQHLPRPPEVKQQSEELWPLDRCQRSHWTRSGSVQLTPCPRRRPGAAALAVVVEEKGAPS